MLRRGGGVGKSMEGVRRNQFLNLRRRGEKEIGK